MASSTLIGKSVIGNYRITRELGEGGMGAVYVAQHQSMDERLAVKVLLPQWSSNQQIVSRFLAEARAASAIKHHNIIRMIDAGVLDTGEHFIAMEYLDGYPLDSVEFPLPLDAALRILVQMCAGLEAAHGRGIIHRDLKPANVFVTPQPHNDLFVKILDFGIAKLTDEHLAGGVKTLSHQAMGTPYYMSPEQARATRDVDHLTDVYALGAIAFELVTGQRPYMPTSIGDLVLQQHTGPPPNPRSVRPDVPVGWADVIVASLANDPTVRPQGVRDFAERLIAATPNGVALAHSVGYEIRGLPTPVASPALGPTLTADGHGSRPTTLSSGVGQSVRGPIGTVARPSSRNKIIAGVAATVVVAAAVFVAISLTRGGGGEPDDTIASENAPVDAGARAVSSAIPTPPDAQRPPDAAPAMVTMTINTKPGGGLLSIDGDKAAKAPRKVTRPAGSTIEVTASKRRYERASETITVAASDGPYLVELHKKGSRPPRPPAGDKPKTDGTTTPPKDVVTPPKGDPTPNNDPPEFNPNDVGGS